ncbi:MAG: rRNA maturation RNase YbeY [Planctomycetaceae bacterium]
MTTYELDISVSRTSVPVDVRQLQQDLERALHQEQVARAVLSVSIVDNAAIHELNRRHLQHDFPTDVISFALDWSADDRDSPGNGPAERSAGASIEGEIVVSAEFAAESAERCGWSVQNELTLYVVHGMLHLCGYDDLSGSEKSVMRAREISILTALGLEPRYPDDPRLAIPGDDDEPPGPAPDSASRQAAPEVRL